MEHQASRARIRAERRCGEILNETERAKGHRFTGGTTEVPPAEPTLEEMGLTKNQSSKWQQLANVPPGRTVDNHSFTTQRPLRVRVGETIGTSDVPVV